MKGMNLWCQEIEPVGKLLDQSTDPRQTQRLLDRNARTSSRQRTSHISVRPKSVTRTMDSQMNYNVPSMQSALRDALFAKGFRIAEIPGETWIAGAGPPVRLLNPVEGQDGELAAFLPFKPGTSGEVCQSFADRLNSNHKLLGFSVSRMRLDASRLKISMQPRSRSHGELAGVLTVLIETIHGGCMEAYIADHGNLLAPPETVDIDAKWQSDPLTEPVNLLEDAGAAMKKLSAHVQSAAPPVLQNHPIGCEMRIGYQQGVLQIFWDPRSRSIYLTAAFPWRAGSTAHQRAECIRAMMRGTRGVGITNTEAQEVEDLPDAALAPLGLLLLEISRPIDVAPLTVGALQSMVNIMLASCRSLPVFDAERTIDWTWAGTFELSEDAS